MLANAKHANQVCVVYLVRARNGLDPFKNFLRSLDRWTAGVEHDLLLVYKGFNSRQQLDPFVELGRQFNPKEHHMADFGFDVRAYYLAMRHFDYGHFCFLNSFSEILGDNWLSKLYASVRREGVGLAGATGSWESMYTNALIRRSSLKSPPLLARLWNPLRLRISQRCFDPFPNYHIRTNGFIISRQVMQRTWPRWVATKRAAYLFENGRTGLTKRIFQLQLDALVVGKDGQTYQKEKWPRSDTFRQGLQENLLIGDNQTRHYLEADYPTRGFLSQAAWGDQARPGPN